MTTKKTGRKQRHFVAADGSTIIGLSRRPSDGRWRVIGTQQTFTEPDEKKAIRRFYELTDEIIPGIEAKRSEVLALRDHLDEIIAEHERTFWEKVAAEIIKRPQYVAQQTGIEQISYLTDLKPPTPPTKVETISETWKLATVKGKQQRKVQNAWDD